MTPTYELKPAELLTLVLQRQDGRVDVVRGIVSGAPAYAGRRPLIIEMRDVVDVD